jgi:Family of unknown function (DUF5681)
MTGKRSKATAAGERVGYRNPPKSGQFVKGRSGNPRGRPPKKTAPGIGIGGHSEFDALFLEEMNRQVAVREGETVERTSVMRAAVRAIALKAAKGDVKAYTALAARRDAIEDRRRAYRQETLRVVLEYDEVARLELMRRKRKGVSGPEIIPHPDDINIDSDTGSIVLHGPLTADQKMGHDLMISTWPAVEREIRNWPLFKAKDPSILGMYAKYKRQADAVGRRVARRASKVNSWDIATQQERMDYLRRVHWPMISKKSPFANMRSDFWFKTTFRLFLGIEPSEEERRAFLEEARPIYLALP